MGKLEGSYVFASESCALDAAGAEFVRDIEPGEIVVVVTEALSQSKITALRKARNLFAFLSIFISARTDSIN